MKKNHYIPDIAVDRSEAACRVDQPRGHDPGQARWRGIEGSVG